MKQVLIFHGTCGEDEYYSSDFPSLSNSHWMPWLQKELLKKGYLAQTPEILYAFNPTYEKYSAEINRYQLDEETVLVGHSCGAGFLLRYLSENNVKLKKVILIAPWLDPLREQTTDMFEFKLNQNLVNRSGQLVIYNSSNDDDSIKESLKIIQNEISGFKLKNFKNYGHFCYKDIGPQFPELLEEVLA